MNYNYNHEKISHMAVDLFKEERSKMRLDGWFYIKRIQKECDKKYENEQKEMKAAKTLCDVCEQLPLSISKHAIFAGTQSDSFARSYALINPSFMVETFSGYCDPTAIFDDITPSDEITAEEIEQLREYAKHSEYVKELNKAQESVTPYTKEVAFFVEQVTGHTIADFRPVLQKGISGLISEIDLKLASEKNAEKTENLEAFKTSLQAALILANRYKEIALKNATLESQERAAQLQYLASVLDKVPLHGAENLFEAIQCFMLLWQVMCIEQSPNPFAFSVGNADRIFEPYRKDMDRKTAASLFKHLLVFYNVGDRSWAISQNLIVGGKSSKGEDLSNDTTYALLDAYYDMNLPQPILSVKMHKDTPTTLHEALGRFFFTPGALTPSLFNDESMFTVLSKAGVEQNDLEDYAVAGCQEPLIMGKDNGNTTNSWLNLAKILELTLTNGESLISGTQIDTLTKEDDPIALLKNIRKLFYQNVEFFIDKMVQAANGASNAISLLPVPFLSSLMGGIDYGYDMRDTKNQGTKYNGSGCLIHGLSVVSDSFVAIDTLLKGDDTYIQELIPALKANYVGYDRLLDVLKAAPKYGNNDNTADTEAVSVANSISDILMSKKNYLGNAFRPDYATPSTHLLYGYLVGATPDGRKAREMLNYGIDPLFGDASTGLGFRILSNMKLPFDKMPGGYASHFGVDPKFFSSKTYEEKGTQFKDFVVNPLFFNKENKSTSPFYLYVNVTTPEILRKVLANPKKYAPNGIYIMRIHGTFVNFLDLSSAIQEDIIARLDLESTRM